MSPLPAPAKLGTFAFVVDDRLAREKKTIVMRGVNALRRIADIQILGGDISEALLIKRLEERNYSLVFVPWYRYLAWSRLDAFYGISRTSGPTIVGYFADPVQPYEMEAPTASMRSILLDFSRLSPAELLIMVRALAIDTERAGIQPLLRLGTEVHTDIWAAGERLGAKLDDFFAIPTVLSLANDGRWAPRFGAIRVCLMALWGLIFEEGPGKHDADNPAFRRPIRASFQVGFDSRMLTLRIFYSLYGNTPRDTLNYFWPNGRTPSSPGQLLQRHSDFLRVHTVPESPFVEVVIGFLPSSPSVTAPDELRTLWIEPVSERILNDQTGNGQDARGKVIAIRPGRPAAGGEDRLTFIEQRAVDAEEKVIQLKRVLHERDDQLRELKSGGIGNGPGRFAPPDADALLEAFQARYFEARMQIRQLEAQVEQAEAQGASTQQIMNLKQRIEALLNREQVWIYKLAQTIADYKQARRKPSG